MSKETLEELKAIVDTSPRGATHIDNYCDYIKVVGGDFYGWSDQLNEWGVFEYADSVTMRSLSDIKRIIELMEATKCVLSIFGGVGSYGTYRNEIEKARKALGLEV